MYVDYYSSNRAAAAAAVVYVNDQHVHASFFFSSLIADRLFRPACSLKQLFKFQIGATSHVLVLIDTTTAVNATRMPSIVVTSKQ